MNYKQMLDKFEYLEAQIAHLENENKHTRERLARLEYPEKYAVKGPGFTPGTLPQQVPSWPDSGWTITCKDKPQRNYGTQGQEFQ